ncbi:hypothetical protein SAMN05660380_01524 [Xylella fastidiosa]|jgi:hypothetical protein|nr:hypothetical protein SAMN05660380_01524 [Xylella fastidiosa]
MAMKHFERLCNVDLYAVPPTPHFIFFQVRRGICRQCSISGAVRVVGMPEYDAMVVC